MIHPGFEDLLVEELAELGVPAKVDVGGVVFPASPANLVRVHAGSFLAGKVLVRMGSFKATSLAELAAGVAGQPWRAVGLSRQEVKVEVTATRSRLRFRDSMEAKVAHAVQDALRGTGRPGLRPSETPIGVHVRIVEDRVQLSVDASGDRLHRRGWREATAKAPIRENLAAAILRAAAYRPGETLIDPFCGAGTFPIEAARRALGRTPRMGWHYPCDTWPGVGRVPTAPPRPKVAPGLILGSDRDEGAVRASRDNARRAEVSEHVHFNHVPFEDRLPPPGAPGLLVGNLPWGLRVAESAELTRLYSRWGEALRTRWSGWRAAFLVSDARMLGRLHPQATVVRTFEDGGVRVSLGLVPCV